MIFHAVVGLNTGQSEPAGTCEKQRYCSFSLSIRYVRTNFSSEKLSCTRPTSEGICFAKQSEQWLTKPLLSQARLARACPGFRPTLQKRTFYSPFLFITSIVRKACTISFLFVMQRRTMRNKRRKGFRLRASRVCSVKPPVLLFFSDCLSSAFGSPKRDAFGNIRAVF